MNLFIYCFTSGYDPVQNKHVIVLLFRVLQLNLLAALISILFGKALPVMLDSQFRIFFF